ncbi:hypothetical protein [Endozoicomonas atrinae]|uniref:hypothetical protein n=1 Tax=Endozoicomonas atrinae TaxID=1333660 RepID=UPI00082486E4|nr:hypothetical protein [Endozoicomonas atrinae]
MKKTLFAIVSSSVILFSANASADRDYAAQAMERHGMEEPLSMPMMNVFNARASLDSIVVPTRHEKLQARMEELSERRGN